MSSLLKIAVLGLGIVAAANVDWSKVTGNGTGSGTPGPVAGPAPAGQGMPNGQPGRGTAGSDLGGGYTCTAYDRTDPRVHKQYETVDAPTVGTGTAYPPRPFASTDTRGMSLGDLQTQVRAAHQEYVTAPRALEQEAYEKYVSLDRELKARIAAGQRGR